MDLKSLRYFVEIARQKSFTTAAQKLFVTQPTLSRQIADLEEELGQKLFERTTRRIELTEKGIFLFKQAQSILELVEKTKREAMSTQELAGDLTISAAETPAMAIIADVLEKFREAHPNVRCHIYSSNAQDALLSIRTGLSNVGLFSMPADLDGLESISLPVRNVWGVLTRRDGPFAGKAFIEPQDLIGKPLLASRQRLIDGRLAGWLGFPFERLQIVGTYNLLYNASFLVRAGAHALCLEGIVKPDEEVMFLPLKPAFTSEVVLAWPQNAPKRTLTDAFLAAVRQALEPL